MGQLLRVGDVGYSRAYEDDATIDALALEPGKVELNIDASALERAAGVVSWWDFILGQLAEVVEKISIPRLRIEQGMQLYSTRGGVFVATVDM
jgi:hypothetical protein